MGGNASSARQEEHPITEQAVREVFSAEKIRPVQQRGRRAGLQGSELWTFVSGELAVEQEEPARQARRAVGPTFRGWLAEEYRGVRQQSKSRIIQDFEKIIGDPDGIHVLNPRGNGLCLLNARAMALQQKNPTAQQPKNMLLQALRKSGDVFGLQSQIEKISDDTPNLNYAMATVFPFLARNPTHVVVYRLVLREKPGITVELDTRELVERPGVSRVVEVFIVSDTPRNTGGHFWLLVR